MSFKVNISPGAIVAGIVATAALYFFARLTGNQTIINTVDAVQNAGVNLGALFTTEAQKMADLNKARGFDPVSGLLTPEFWREIDDAGGIDAYIKQHGGKAAAAPSTSVYKFWL